MNVSLLKKRIDALLETALEQSSSIIMHRTTLYQGTVGVMHALYGPHSSRERDLRTYVEQVTEKAPTNPNLAEQCILAITGALVSMKDELEIGFLGSLRAGIAGELLTDLIKLARTVLDQKGDDAKNVAAVLVAAAFEDTMRRLADLQALPHEEKLADVLTALKSAGILQGAEVGIAQSYLSFRNKALHAQWTEIDLPGVQSALAFTEQIILQRFI